MILEWFCAISEPVMTYERGTSTRLDFSISTDCLYLHYETQAAKNTESVLNF